SPIIHAIATDDLTSLSFATDDDYIFLGADIDPDTGQTAVKMYENVLSDRANDMTLWDGIGQSNITWELENGKPAKTSSFKQTINTIRVNSYGEKTETAPYKSWRGPVMKRMLTSELD
ncbi:TPA: phage tail protein, partial [Listeria monocytogenes]|nr:phage tail protein [Listeria monocytogenes]